MNTPELTIITQMTDADIEAAELLEHKERRDRFALVALPVILAEANDSMDVADIANACYVIADAMITRRQA